MDKPTKRNGRRWLADINHAIGDMPIAKVDEQIIIEKLLTKDNLWVTNNPTATGIQHKLSAMFKLAITKGYVPRGYNPALWENISGSLPERKRVHKTKHHPGVPWRKMPEFMQDLFAYRHSGRLQCFEGVPPIVLWLALAALSGGRPGEARLAQWKEFDFDNMIWTIPIEHLKMGHTYDEDKPKRVPISSAMHAVLKLAKKIAYPSKSSTWMDGHKRGPIFPNARHKPDSSPDALVFPNTVNAPFNEPEGARHMRTQLKKWLPAVPHGFRTSHKDWWLGNPKPFPKEWWAANADHRGDEMQQTYGTEDFLEQRRRPMELWGQFLLPGAKIPAGKSRPRKKRRPE
jgi:integrase